VLREKEQENEGKTDPFAFWAPFKNLAFASTSMNASAAMKKIVGSKVADRLKEFESPNKEGMSSTLANEHEESHDNPGSSQDEENSREEVKISNESMQ
jgi:hypothetical protein